MISLYSKILENPNFETLKPPPLSFFTYLFRRPKSRGTEILAGGSILTWIAWELDGIAIEYYNEENITERKICDTLEAFYGFPIGGVLTLHGGTRLVWGKIDFQCSSSATKACSSSSTAQETEKSSPSSTEKLSQKE